MNRYWPSLFVTIERSKQLRLRVDSELADFVEEQCSALGFGECTGAPLHYPHLSHTEIFDSVETFYRRFYFRRSKIAAIVGEMARSPEMMRRRLREGIEFFQFLRERRQSAH